MDGICIVLILLLHYLLIFGCQIFLPSFHTYREKGNVLAILLHGHQITEMF